MENTQPLKIESFSLPAFVDSASLGVGDVIIAMVALRENVVGLGQ